MKLFLVLCMLLLCQFNLGVDATDFSKFTDRSEVIAALNAEKYQWLEQRFNTGKIVSQKHDLNYEINTIAEGFKALVKDFANGKTESLEKYFGERTQGLYELIDHLDSGKAAWLNQYLPDFMKTYETEQKKSNNEAWRTKTFEDGSMIKLLRPLRFSKDGVRITDDDTIESHIDFSKLTDRSEVVAALNAEKYRWLEKRFKTGKIVQSKYDLHHEVKTIAEGLKALRKDVVNGNSGRLENYFGERTQGFYELIDYLDSGKAAWLSQYLPDFMKTYESEQKGKSEVWKTKTFENGSSIKLLKPLRFSKDGARMTEDDTRESHIDLSKLKDRSQVVAALNAEKYRWLEKRFKTGKIVQEKQDLNNEVEVIATGFKTLMEDLAHGKSEPFEKYFGERTQGFHELIDYLDSGKAAWLSQYLPDFMKAYESEQKKAKENVFRTKTFEDGSMVKLLEPLRFNKDGVRVSDDKPRELDRRNLFRIAV